MFLQASLLFLSILKLLTFTIASSNGYFIIFLFIFIVIIELILGRFSVLKVQDFKYHIDKFNSDDEELYPQYFTNANSWNFLVDNIPFFECPDRVGTSLIVKDLIKLLQYTFQFSRILKELTTLDGGHIASISNT